MHADFPLFPLPLVAMPHCRLALQIFEPRYLDLVKTSLAKQQSFGIVTVDATNDISVANSSDVNVNQPGTAASTPSPIPPLLPLGTAVRIVDFSQQANGLLGIVCEGLFKFRVHDSRVNEHGLQVASIETIPAELMPAKLMPAEAGVSLPQQFDELTSVLQALLEHEYARKLGYANGSDEQYWRQHAVELAWHLAYLLPLPDAVKYRWLTMDDTHARLASLLDAVNQLQGVS